MLFQGKQYSETYATDICQVSIKFFSLLHAFWDALNCLQMKFKVDKVRHTGRPLDLIILAFTKSIP